MGGNMTITDVARKAGVSKTTVSRYLNKSGYVGEKTRKRIEKVIEENRYIPMAAAQNLSKGKSNTVAVLIPEIANPYFAAAFEGISEVADENHLNVFFYNTSAEPEKEEDALYSMKTQGVRGAIITPSVDFENIESTRRYKKLLQAIGLPIVFMDVSVSLELGDGVFVDNQLGAYQAVEAMIEKGYREIGFIGARKSKSVKDRFRGYSSAMDTHGIPIQEEFLVDVDVSTIGPCYETIKEFLQKKKHPQAFFTSNTLTTIGFIKAVSELGMELEKDIACMAFDKVDFIEMLKLKCNYLERSPYDMGKTATQLLLNRLDHPEMLATRKLMPFNIVMCGD